MTSKLPGHTVRKISVDASVHPDTITRYLEDKPVRPAIQDRIENALKAQGLASAIRPLALTAAPKSRA